MASDAETARRGGNEAEKTEAGELIRCAKVFRPEYERVSLSVS